MLGLNIMPIKEYASFEYPWIIDTIQEKFDDALDILEESCILYGGAIRDAIADLPLKGDLDIAVPRSLAQAISNNFSNSVRWISDNKLPSLSGSANPTTAKKVINNVYNYKNIDGRSVQLIIPQISADTVQNIDAGIFDIVSNVDIVCCGLLSDLFGNVYEVVPGAIKDCEAHVLNFNYNIQVTKSSIKHLKERINKLEKRGWKNNINIDSIKIIEDIKPKTTDLASLFGGK